MGSLQIIFTVWIRIVCWTSVWAAAAAAEQSDGKSSVSPNHLFQSTVVINNGSFSSFPNLMEYLAARSSASYGILNGSGPVEVNMAINLHQIINVNQRLNQITVSGSFSLFGSWAYSVQFIMYRPDPHVYLQSFFDNQEWLLDRAKVTPSFKDTEKSGNFSTVTLSLFITRQSFFYIFNVVIPATVITVTSVIGVHSGTPKGIPRTPRFQLGIVTLLPMGVLLLTIGADLPKFSKKSVAGQRGSFSGVPLLGLYYMRMILLISCSTITYNMIVWLDRQFRNQPAAQQSQFRRFVERRMANLTSKNTSSNVAAASESISQPMDNEGAIKITPSIDLADDNQGNIQQQQRQQEWGNGREQQLDWDWEAWLSRLEWLSLMAYLTAIAVCFGTFMDHEADDLMTQRKQ